MTQTSLYDDENNQRAQALIKVIEEFIDELYVRTDDKRKVTQICQGTPPTGYDLDQEPERFVVEHFIRPVVGTLGYEEYLPQPRGLPGLGQQTPDFLLTDVDEVTILGEVKRPGDSLSARKESFDYLTDLKVPIAAGISTDGFTWHLHWVVENERPIGTKHVSLRSAIKGIRQERLSDKGSRKRRRRLRSNIHEFVAAFEREKIIKQAKNY